MLISEVLQKCRILAEVFTADRHFSFLMKTRNSFVKSFSVKEIIHLRKHINEVGFNSFVHDVQ